MKIVRFRPEHLRSLSLQSEQRAMDELLRNPSYGTSLALAGPAFTAIVDGRPIICAGVQEYHPGRAEAWALLGDDSGPYLRRISRAVEGWLQQCSYLRVEASVSAGFLAGQRWARLLGFQQEGPVRRAYMPDGGDAFTFVRFLDGSTSNTIGRGRYRAGGLGHSTGQLRQQRREGSGGEPEPASVGDAWPDGHP